jgi:hypothetical protein
MKIWKGNENNTTLFSLKELEMLHQERRGQVNTIVMEHFNNILFHKFGPAIKQHTYHHHHLKTKPENLSYIKFQAQLALISFQIILYDIKLLTFLALHKIIMDICYLFQMGREENILRQWLDVCVTEGGILVAQQRLHKRPLLVAQMVEEWLNHYRRLA